MGFRHTQNQVKNMAERVGLCMETVCPGDGKTRYSFYFLDPKEHTYGKILEYCVGAREAYLFLRGFSAGRKLGQKARRGTCSG
jgi:hypothetical protein